MTFVVLGAAGMLGTAVAKELHRRGYAVNEQTHKSCPIDMRPPLEALFDHLTPDDIVINCAGALKGDFATLIKTNSLGPQLAGSIAIQRGIPFIHVSTDCVFKGDRDQAYTVYSIPDATEEYGRSKMVGESIAARGNNITIVRTSFIGFRHGLLNWFLSEARAKNPHAIKGWANAWWSGSTVDAVAAGLATIAEKTPGGIHHLSTDLPVSKYDLLCQLSTLFGLNARIVKTNKPYINRALFPTDRLPPISQEFPALLEQYHALYRTADLRA